MKFAAAVPQDIRHGHFKARDEPDKTCYKLITSLGFLSMSKDPENLSVISKDTAILRQPDRRFYFFGLLKAQVKPP